MKVWITQNDVLRLERPASMKNHMCDNCACLVFGLWSLCIQMEAFKHFGSICYIDFGTFLIKQLFGRFKTASTGGQTWMNQLLFWLH
jgi:hypothetical protein